MTASVVLRGGCMMTWWSTGSTPKLEGEGEGREGIDGIGNRKTYTYKDCHCLLIAYAPTHSATGVLHDIAGQGLGDMRKKKSNRG